MIRRLALFALLVLVPANALLAVDLPFQSIPERSDPWAFRYPDDSARRIADCDIVAYSHEWGDTIGHGIYADIEFEAVIHGETTGYWAWEDAPLGKYFFKVAGTDSVFTHPQYHRMGLDLVPPESVDSSAVLPSAIASPHLADSLINDQSLVKSNVLHTRHLLAEEVKEGDIAPNAINANHLQAGVAAQNIFDPETHVSLTGDALGLPDSTYLTLDTLNVRIVFNTNTLLVQSDSTLNPVIAILYVDDGQFRLRAVDATFENDVTIDDSLFVGDQINADNASAFHNIAGSILLGNDLTVGDQLSVTNVLATAQIAGGMTIGEQAQIDGDLLLFGAADMRSSVSIADSLNVGVNFAAADSQKVSFRAQNIPSFPDAMIDVTFPTMTASKGFAFPGAIAGRWRGWVNNRSADAGVVVYKVRCGTNGWVTVTTASAFLAAQAITIYGINKW